MKTTRQHGEAVRARRAAKVRVEFHHATATAIGIAGTFNDWRPDATPLVSLGDGRWIKELVLPAGTYEYRFVVDGEWMPDPHAEATVPNPFGGANSVLQVDNAVRGGARQR